MKRVSQIRIKLCGSHPFLQQRTKQQRIINQSFGGAETRIGGIDIAKMNLAFIRQRSALHKARFFFEDDNGVSTLGKVQRNQTPR